MKPEVKLRKPIPDEAAILSALAMRSKSYWGYSDEFMEACREELSVSADQIRGGIIDYVVAEKNSDIIGFYGLRRVSSSRFELDALFVEPAYIGTGVGRTLIQHAVSAAALGGASTLFVQSDPHAEKFYRAVGGIPSGNRESASIPGRFLPTFELTVTEPSA